MTKYYNLRRNNATILNDSISDLPIKLREECIKRTDFKHSLILIEKTYDEYHIESKTNVWTMEEGVPNLWQKFTKGHVTYDYTGIVSPLIHLNGIVKLSHDYFFQTETKF